MANIGVKVKLEINDARTQLKDLENEIKQLGNRKIELAPKVDQFNKLKSDLRDVNSEINKVENSLRELNSIKSTGGSWTKEQTEQARQLRAQLQVLKQDARNIKFQISSQGLDTAVKETQQLDREIKSLNNQKIKINGRINGLEQSLGSANKLSSSLSKISSTGKSIESLSRHFNKLGSAISNVRNIFDSTFGGKLFHTLNKGIVYSSLYRVTSEAMNLAQDVVSQAITRYDTLQATNVTWSNMGFDMATIQNARNTLSEKVMGLPTTLDEAIQKTTQISAVTKDLDLAVDVYSALNNAVLAFGGDSNQAERAITQFSQTIGKGVIDARTYNALLDDGMGPALAEIARQFGYTSENIGQFREDLGSGKISANEFMEALVDLDKNGSDAMASLQKIAKDTSSLSISMAFTNLKTRMAMGIEETMSALNEAFQQGIGMTIPDAIREIGNTLKAEFLELASYVNSNQDGISEWIANAKDSLSDFWNTIKNFDYKSFFEGIKEGAQGLKWQFDFLKSIAQGVKPIIEMLGGGDFAKGLGKVVSSWYSLNVAFKLTSSFTRIADASISGLGGILTTFIGVVGRANNMLGKFSLGSTKLGQSMSKIGGWFTSKFSKTTGTTTGTSNVDASAITVTDYSGQLKQLGLKHLNRLAGIVEIAGISATMLLVAKSLKELNEAIPSNIGELAPKLATMGAVISALSLFVAGMGEVANFVGLKATLVGTASMLGSGGALWLLSKSMQEFDKIPEFKEGKVMSKLGSLMTVMTSITAYQTALGTMNLVGSGGLQLLAQSIGAVSNVLTSSSLSAMAEAINNLDKIPSNVGSISSKLETLKTIVNEVSSLDMSGTVVTTETTTQNGISTTKTKKEDLSAYLDEMAESIASLSEIAEYSKKLSNMSIPENITKKAESLKNAIKEIDELLSDVFSQDMSGSRARAIGHSKDVESFEKVTGNLVELAKNLSKIQNVELDGDAVSKKVTDIASSMKTIADEINKIDVQEFVANTSGEKEKSNFSLFSDFAVQLSEMMGSFQTTLDSFKTINEFDVNFNWDNLTTIVTQLVQNISHIGQVINESFGDDGELKFSKNVKNRWKNVGESISSMVDTLESMITLNNTINEKLGGSLSYSDGTTISLKVEQLVSEISKVAQIMNPQNEMDENFFRFNKDAKNRWANLKEALQSTIDTLNEIITLRNTLDQQFDGWIGQSNVTEKINQLITQLIEIGNALSGKEFESALSDTTNIENAKSVITSLTEMVESLKSTAETVGDFTSINNLVANAKSTFKSIAEINIPQSEFSSNITSVVDGFSEAITTLKNMATDYEKIGEDWANGILNGFKSADVSSEISKLIDNLIKELNKKQGNFKTVGNSYGKSLSDGMKSSVNGSASSIGTSLVNGLNSQSSAIAQAGRSLGLTFANAFRENTSNLSVNVTSTGISAINSVRTQNRWHGGIIRGASGVDNVPAMLTSGEYVIRKSVVDSIGVPFLDRLNNMNLRGAYKSLNANMSMQAVGGMAMTTVNNYTTNNNNRSVNITETHNHRSQEVRANRFLRAL